MKKRLVVSCVALAALAAIAAPAFGQNRATPRSIHKAMRSSAGALSPKALNAARPAAPRANWNIGSSMSVATAEHGGAAAAGSRLFVPGGFDSNGAVFGQMQIYNITANTWSLDPDLLVNLTGLPGVADAAICADNTGKIHVINGTLDGQFIYAAHLVFTPTAPVGSKWSFLAAPNVGADGNFYSQDSGCTFLAGKLYLYGGAGLDDNDPQVVALQRRTWVYDPATDTWSDSGRLMQVGRIWQSYTNNASRAFVCGGSDNLVTQVPINRCETFTTTAGWKNMASLPAARLGAGMGFLGSTLTVYGGIDASNAVVGNTYGCVGSACGPGPWNDLNKNLNTARALHGWGFGGGKIIAAGGISSTSFLSSSENTT